MDNGNKREIIIEIRRVGLIFDLFTIKKRLRNKMLTMRGVGSSGVPVN